MINEWQSVIKLVTVIKLLDRLAVMWPVFIGYLGMFSDYQSVRLYFTLTAMVAPIKSFNNGIQICLGLNANEIHIPHDKHHKVSYLVKSRRHTNTLNSVKYEVIERLSMTFKANGKRQTAKITSDFLFFSCNP